MSNMVPTFIAYINGQRFSAEQEADVKEITLIDVVDLPSMLSLTMSDVQKGSGKKLWRDDPNIFVGSEIKLKLGYKDQVVDVFIGEIIGLAPSLQRNMDDSLRIMVRSYLYRLDRAKKIRDFVNKSDVDIIKDLAQKNGLNGKSIQGISTEKHKFTMQKDRTDLEHIISIIERNNCTMHIKNKNIYIDKLNGTGADLVLEYGKTLLQFAPKMDVRGLVTEVIVKGYNAASDKEIEGIANSKQNKITFRVGGNTTGNEIRESEICKTTTILLDNDVMDIKSAEAVALNFLTRNSMDFIQGAGKAIGDPNIKAGCFIDMKGLANKFNGIYYATSVRHRFYPLQGYVTEFYLRRNCVMKPKKAKSLLDDEQQRPPRQKQEQLGKNPKIMNLKWKDKDYKDIQHAMIDEKVKLTADVYDIDDGESVQIKIFEKDADGKDDLITETALSTGISKGKISLGWTMKYTTDEDDANSQQEKQEKGYTLPEYYFKVYHTRYDIETGESPILETKDSFNLKLINETGKTIANTEYTLILPDGSERKGKTDQDGLIKEKNILPGKKSIVIGNGDFTVVDYKTQKNK